MSIFARVADIFKANINDLLDRAEDPEKMIKQMVIEMEEAVSKATLALGNAIANQKSLEREMNKKQIAIDDYQKKAIEAVNAGRDDLAKKALERKNTLAADITSLQTSLDEAKKVTDSLRSQLDTLKTKLEEARMRQSTLIARAQAAKAKKEIAQSISGIGNDSFSNFERFERKIEKDEAQADAIEEISKGSSTSLDAELDALSTSSAADTELEALKKSLGK